MLSGLDRRWDQQRMPADHAEVLNTSIFPDDRVQLHFSFNPRLPRKRRILGRLSRLQFLLKQGAADSDSIHYRWQAGRRVGPIARERDLDRALAIRRTGESHAQMFIEIFDRLDRRLRQLLGKDLSFAGRQAREQRVPSIVRNSPNFNHLNPPAEGARGRRRQNDQGRFEI